MTKIRSTFTFLSFFIFGITLSSFPQTADEMKAVMQGIREAHNAHDMDAYLSYFTEDAVFSGTYYGAEPLDPEGHREFFEIMFHANPDNAVDTGLELISGNVLIQEHNLSGTAVNEFNFLPATGESYIWPHVDVLDFEGTKAKSYTTHGDFAVFLITTGLMPAPDPIEFIPSFTLPDSLPNDLSPTEAVIASDAAWNSKDMNNYATYFSSNADLFISSLGAPLNRDEYIAAQEMYLLAFSNRQLETTRRLDCGDGWVVSEVTFSGINDGPFMGIPPTNKPFEIKGINITRINEQGLITYLHNYHDNILLMAQLGIFQTSSISSKNWELYH